MDSDIRKWFLKQPHRNSSNAVPEDAEKQKESIGISPESRSDLKKTSRFFSGNKDKPGNEEGTNKTSTEKSPVKRKQDDKLKEFPASKKCHVDDVKKEGNSLGKSHAGEVKHNEKAKTSPPKKTQVGDVNNKEKDKAISPSPKKWHTDGKVIIAKKEILDGGGSDDADADADDFKDLDSSPAKGRGRGRGRGRGTSSSPMECGKPPSGGRGRGGWGRGGGGSFFEPRQAPPHKGEKEVPNGAEDCLVGLTFVISGTLDSLEREEAEDLIKRHGGRVTTSVSKKTSYLLADEDVGGRKSQKAKELGVAFLTEDGLFTIIRSSKPKQASPKPSSVTPISQIVKSEPSRGNQQDQVHKSAAPVKKALGNLPSRVEETEAWPQKHRPKSTTEIVGNQSIVKQLHDWLQQWFEVNLQGKQQKGKKRVGDNSSSNTKKAVLLSGPPGIGKTTSARLICELLGFESFEVNASDSRGKADTKVGKGIGGSTANVIKEMVSNESLAVASNGKKHKKAVLIMDEVDGMSGGDRGGVADLIASIKISKIPIICICNDRYSQKLKSLVNYCLPLNFRKPTKQQMAKRLQQIAKAEGMQVDEMALEELAERVNGDMRMALNELQYMNLRTQVVKFDDVKARLRLSGKDEDMSPFTAVDRLMSFEGGRLRMDERLDASMSDPDLVPLLIQENYLNYCPTQAGRDENGTARMDLIAKAASCIADGDIVNKQIRQYRQWQHSQMGAFMSSIIPAALMHGRREILLQGERNFNRFGSWLGKNSSYGKKMRQLDDVHVHLLASRTCEPTRQAVRRDYLYVLALELTSPLKVMPKEKAVQIIVELMENYSLTQEDIDSILDLVKFQGQPDLMAGVPPAVKAALTKGYKQMESERRVKSSDLLPLFNASGQKKLPKKRGKLKILPPELDDEEIAEDEEGEDSEDDEASNVDEIGLDTNMNMQLHVAESSSKGDKQKAKGSQPRQTATKRSAPKDGQQSKPAKRRKE